MIVKKYGNRRLYDTEGSRYITLDELAQIVRGGTDVRVVDAKTSEDLTQVTLTQILVEGRGAAHLFSVPLLTQLVRMGDDALAEFFGRYVTWALEVYVQTKQSARALGPLNPFALMGGMGGMGGGMGGNPFMRGMMNNLGWGDMGPSPMQVSPPPPPEPAAKPVAPAPAPTSEMAELRRELEALKRTVRRRKK